MDQDTKPGHVQHLYRRPVTPEDQDTAPKFRLTIMQDEGPTDPPGDGDDFWVFHSFNSSHVSFSRPEEVMACQECGSTRDEYFHTDVPQTNDGDFRYGDWAEEYRAEHPEELHTYQPPEGFVLSYFEHGNCRWGLAGTMDSTPDFRWDGVRIAGFLEVHPEVGGIDGDRSWWDDMTQEERNKVAESFLEEYTAWCNGEVYGYSLERINAEVCNLGFTHENQPEQEDSCFGFIGFDYFQEAVSEATHDMGATEDNTEVVDKAYGMAAYGKFFEVPETPEHCVQCGKEVSQDSAGTLVDDSGGDVCGALGGNEPHITEPEKGVTDRFGHTWDFPEDELCPECGQPDSVGDCDHNPLTDAERAMLRGDE